MKNPQNTITLAEAQEWAARWRSNPVDGVRAFLIPGEDITGLLEEHGKDFRAYLGVDELGAAKLMLVAVDEEGLDMIDENNGKYIYDFTTPCPTVCDTESPLYDLKK